MIKKIFTLFLVVSFSLNTISTEIAVSQSLIHSTFNVNLSVPSICTELVGGEHKDIGRIKFALASELKEYTEGEGGWIFSRIPKIVNAKESTIYHPANMQFFFREMTPVKGGEAVCVRSRIKEQGEVRDYYVVFSSKSEDGEDFPVLGIYTEDEYKEYNKFKDILPKRREEDEKAIERYLQHEKIIDEWIRNKMLIPDNCMELDSSYTDPLWGGSKTQAGTASDPNYFNKALDGKLQELLPKKIILIKTKNEDLPVIHEDGKKVVVNGHSSKNGMYIFVSEEVYEGLAQRRQVSFIMKDEVFPQIVHEIGVMCDLPWQVKDNGKITNELDIAYQNIKGKSYEEIASMSAIKSLRGKLEPVDLDANLLTRDYAMAKNKKQIRPAQALQLMLNQDLLSDTDVSEKSKQAYEVLQNTDQTIFKNLIRNVTFTKKLSSDTFANFVNNLWVNAFIGQERIDFFTPESQKTFQMISDLNDVCDMENSKRVQKDPIHLSLDIFLRVLYATFYQRQDYRRIVEDFGRREQEYKRYQAMCGADGKYTDRVREIYEMDNLEEADLARDALMKKLKVDIDLLEALTLIEFPLIKAEFLYLYFPAYFLSCDIDAEIKESEEEGKKILFCEIFLEKLWGTEKAQKVLKEAFGQEELKNVEIEMLNTVNGMKAFNFLNGNNEKARDMAERLIKYYEYLIKIGGESKSLREKINGLKTDLKIGVTEEKEEDAPDQIGLKEAIDILLTDNPQEEELSSAVKVVTSEENVDVARRMLSVGRIEKKLDTIQYTNFINNLWEMLPKETEKNHYRPFSEEAQEIFSLIIAIENVRMKRNASVAKKANRGSKRAKVLSKIIGRNEILTFRVLFARLYGKRDHEKIIVDFGLMAKGRQKAEKMCSKEAKYLPELLDLYERDAKGEEDPRALYNEAMAFKSKIENYDQLDMLRLFYQIFHDPATIDLYFFARIMNKESMDYIKREMAGKKEKRSFIEFFADWLFGEGKGLESLKEIYKDTTILDLQERMVISVKAMMGFFNRNGETGKEKELAAVYKEYLEYTYPMILEDGGGAANEDPLVRNAREEWEACNEIINKKSDAPDDEQNIDAKLPDEGALIEELPPRGLPEKEQQPDISVILEQVKAADILSQAEKLLEETKSITTDAELHLGRLKQHEKNVKIAQEKKKLDSAKNQIEGALKKVNEVKRSAEAAIRSMKSIKENGLSMQEAERVASKARSKTAQSKNSKLQSARSIIANAGSAINGIVSRFEILEEERRKKEALKIELEQEGIRGESAKFAERSQELMNIVSGIKEKVNALLEEHPKNKKLTLLDNGITERIDDLREVIPIFIGLGKRIDAVSEKPTIHGAESIASEIRTIFYSSRKKVQDAEKVIDGAIEALNQVEKELAWEKAEKARESLMEESLKEARSERIENAKRSILEALDQVESSSDEEIAGNLYVLGTSFKRGIIDEVYASADYKDLIKKFNEVLTEINSRSVENRIRITVMETINNEIAFLKKISKDKTVEKLLNLLVCLRRGVEMTFFNSSRFYYLENKIENALWLFLNNPVNEEEGIRQKIEKILEEAENDDDIQSFKAKYGVSGSGAEEALTELINVYFEVYRSLENENKKQIDTRKQNAALKRTKFNQMNTNDGMTGYVLEVKKRSDEEFRKIKNDLQQAKNVLCEAEERLKFLKDTQAEEKLIKRAERKVSKLHEEYGEIKNLSERRKQVKEERILEAVCSAVLLESGYDVGGQLETLKLITQLRSSSEAEAIARRALLKYGYEVEEQIKRLLEIASLASTGDAYASTFTAESIARAALYEFGYDPDYQVSRLKELLETENSMVTDVEDSFSDEVITGLSEIFIRGVLFEDGYEKEKQLGIIKEMACQDTGHSGMQVVANVFYQEHVTSSIEYMTDIAKRAGPEIPAGPHQKYTLFLPASLFNGQDNMRDEAEGFKEKFNLITLDDKVPNGFINQIKNLVRSNGDAQNAVVLVPKSMPEGFVLSLVNAGVRFIRMDTDVFNSGGISDARERKKIRNNIYAIMLLMRHVETQEETPLVHELFDFYLKHQFKINNDIDTRSFFDSIISSNVTVEDKKTKYQVQKNGLFLTRPEFPWDNSGFYKISDALIDGIAGEKPEKFTLKPRDRKGQFKERPGKSPEDAMMVIALTDLSVCKSFTLKDYMDLYEIVRQKYPFLEFDQLKGESTPRRDLKALVARGFLTKKRRSRMHYSINKETFTPDMIEKIGELTKNGIYPGTLYLPGGKFNREEKLIVYRAAIEGGILGKRFVNNVLDMTKFDAGNIKKSELVQILASLIKGGKLSETERQHYIGMLTEIAISDKGSITDKILASAALVEVGERQYIPDLRALLHPQYHLGVREEVAIRVALAIAGIDTKYTFDDLMALYLKPDITRLEKIEIRRGLGVVSYAGIIDELLFHLSKKEREVIDRYAPKPVNTRALNEEKDHIGELKEKALKLQEKGELTPEKEAYILAGLIIYEDEITENLKRASNLLEGFLDSDFDPYTCKAEAVLRIARMSQQVPKAGDIRFFRRLVARKDLDVDLQAIALAGSLFFSDERVDVIQELYDLISTGEMSWEAEVVVRFLFLVVRHDSQEQIRSLKKITELDQGQVNDDYRALALAAYHWPIIQLRSTDTTRRPVRSREGGKYVSEEGMNPDQALLVIAIFLLGRKDGFGLDDYLKAHADFRRQYDEEGFKEPSEDTARSDLKQLASMGMLRVDRANKPYTYFFTDGGRDKALDRYERFVVKEMESDPYRLEMATEEVPQKDQVPPEMLLTPLYKMRLRHFARTYKFREAGIFARGPLFDHREDRVSHINELVSVTKTTDNMDLVIFADAMLLSFFHGLAETVKFTEKYATLNTIFDNYASGKLKSISPKARAVLAGNMLLYYDAAIDVYGKPDKVDLEKELNKVIKEAPLSQASFLAINSLYTTLEYDQGDVIDSVIKIREHSKDDAARALAMGFLYFHGVNPDVQKQDLNDIASGMKSPIAEVNANTMIWAIADHEMKNRGLFQLLRGLSKGGSASEIVFPESSTLLQDMGGQTRRIYPESEEEKPMPKNIPAGASSITMDSNKFSVWVSETFDAIGDQPFTESAQQSLQGLLRLNEEREKNEIPIKYSSTFLDILKARLFGARDYKWILDYFERAKEALANNDLTSDESIENFYGTAVTDRDFFELYMITRFVCGDSVNQLIATGDNFMSFCAKSLFGDNWRMVIDDYYRDDNDIFIFEEKLISFFTVLIDFHAERAEYEEAFRILGESLTWIYLQRHLFPFREYIYDNIIKGLAEKQKNIETLIENDFDLSKKGRPEEPGKNPADALKAIALSGLWKFGQFTLKDYSICYKGVRGDYPQLGFKELSENWQATARRDLYYKDAGSLEEKGIIRVLNKGGKKEYIFEVTPYGVIEIAHIITSFLDELPSEQKENYLLWMEERANELFKKRHFEAEAIVRSKLLEESEGSARQIGRLIELGNGPELNAALIAREALYKNGNSIKSNKDWIEEHLNKFFHGTKLEVIARRALLLRENSSKKKKHHIDRLKEMAEEFSGLVDEKGIAGHADPVVEALARSTVLKYIKFVNREFWYVKRLEYIKKKHEGFEAFGIAEQALRDHENKEQLQALASYAGREQIPTHVKERYTLMVPLQFFGSGEFQDHRAKYGDRFNIERVSSLTAKGYIKKILMKSEGIEDKTVALIPQGTQKEDLEKLKEAGIRFVQVDVLSLTINLADLKGDYRRRFQENTYCLMLLVRRLDENVQEGTAVYRLLEFYLKTYFNLQQISAKDYIKAIRKGIISDLVKGYLMCKPAEVFDAVEKNRQISRTMIFA